MPLLPANLSRYPTTQSNPEVCKFPVMFTNGRVWGTMDVWTHTHKRGHLQGMFEWNSGGRVVGVKAVVGENRENGEAWFLRFAVCTT